MSSITRLHDAVKGGDLSALTTLLASDPKLANARSETDSRGTYPLHVSAEFGQAEAAKLLLEYAADVSLLDPNASLEDWRRCVELLQRS